MTPSPPSDTSLSAPASYRFPDSLTTLPIKGASGIAGERDVSLFEFWPGWLFYVPVVAQWIALGLRYGDFSLPTAANPCITAGGLCGESKAMILDQMVGEERQTLARYTSFAMGLDAVDDFATAEAARVAAGLDFPLVVKPDIGCNGTGVRLLNDARALQRYLEDFRRPLAVPGLRLMLQEFVPYDGEAGVFYMRYPGEARGRITSITLKSPPVVIGDGRSTLEALIRTDSRTGRVPQIYMDRLAARLNEIPRSGEQVRLTFVGNHCKGSVFKDGRAHATEALAARIERLARALPDFHFGRFDMRYRSLGELRQGQGFSVIEVNGAGSEATHIWDPATKLAAAYATQFQHYRAAFEIARANRAAGYHSTGLVGLFRLWRLQRRLLASYPVHD
jgi:hypothetical protein